jgi:hypothetical protein
MQMASRENDHLTRADELPSAFTRLLLSAGASERSIGIFLELRGLAGAEPRSLRNVSRGLSAERIRQLVEELESGPLRRVIDSKAEDVTAFRASMEHVLSSIEPYAPGSDESIRDVMAKMEVIVPSPASVLRLADILGCHHEMRLTEWTSRAKYKEGTQRELATQEHDTRRATVTAIVPAAMPEVFDSFITLARKFSRGEGVIAASHLAERFSQERGVPVTSAEAVAFLQPFAVHLGRHDGDDWFAFFNSANDFLRKVATRVALFKHASFANVCAFHRRHNRSLYSNEGTTVPSAVLAASIELAGYKIDGDDVTPVTSQPAAGSAGRGATGIQLTMVDVFRKTLLANNGKKSVPRAVLVTALKEAGIRESTAHMYLGNQGLFICRKGLCRLADEADEAPERTPRVSRKQRAAEASAAA